MESRGLSRRDLEPFIGSREMIRKLHAGLGISAEVLIRPYRIRNSAA